MTTDYHSKNHSKYLLMAHIIFVCKYRLKLLKYQSVREEIIKSLENAQTDNFEIIVMETDLDHIHILIDYDPKLSILSIVRRLKQISTNHIWKIKDLSNFLWKEKTFWSDGYFVCSTGNASTETIKQYILTQG